jgi:hypothetical protein
MGSAATGRHFSSFYRFLSESSWIVDDLGQVVFELMLPFVPDGPLVVPVDDTLCRKTGPHIWGAGMHHDAVLSSYSSGPGGKHHVAFTFGHSWVILSLWVPLPWNIARGIAVPILFRLYRSRKLTPVGDYRKRTQIARELIDVLAGWVKDLHRPVILVGDSEYACRTLVKRLPAGFDFVGPIVFDAALFSPEIPARVAGQRGAPRKRGARLPSPQEMLRDESIPWNRQAITLYGRPVEIWTKSIVCQWYRVTGIRPVKVILTRDPRRRWKDRAYFTTVTSATLEETLTTITRRWCLEVTFRDLKQHLGLIDPQNGWWRRNRARRGPPRPGAQPRGRRGSRAVERTVPLIFSIYGIIYAWYFRWGKPAQDVAAARAVAPWYTSKREPSICDILGALRRHIGEPGEFVANAGKTRIMQQFSKPMRRAA